MPVLIRATAAGRRAGPYAVGAVVWGFFIMVTLQGLWTGAWYGYAFALIFGGFFLWFLIFTRRARKQAAAQLAELSAGPADAAAEFRHPPMRLPWRLVVGGTAVLLAVQLVSLTRPSPAWPPVPPPAAGARWQWFDRCIRFERWPPAKTIPGSYFGTDTTAPSHEVLGIGRNVMAGVSSRPNGTLVVTTFDFCQLNFLQAAVFFLFAGGALAILWEIIAPNRPNRPNRPMAAGGDYPPNTLDRNW